MELSGRNLARLAAAFAIYGLVAALVCAPLTAERAIEGVRFEDRLGTLPVQVSLAHNGVSTVDTGILGRLYWERTGSGGFGASIRATGPPEVGDTLASYVSPKFLTANAQFVNDPAEVARVYGDELRAQLRRQFLQFELGSFVLGGLLLALIFRARAPFPRVPSRQRRAGLAVSMICVGAACSVAAAWWLFSGWDAGAEIGEAYPMPGVDKLSFSSPQTLEVARQIQPFIEKNTDRIRKRTDAYAAAAEASMRTEITRRADALRPREGERIVIAEADPQGSLVGTAVRTAMYPLLRETLGQDSIAIRTISGDVTSNGTLAEEGFVEDEAAASPETPTVAVKGDHDTEITVEQLTDNGVTNPDFDATEVGGLNVIAGNDPAFKTLFGGLVINNSGITEGELGSRLRSEAGTAGSDEPVVVLLHQPLSAAGYIGVETISDLDDSLGRETTPWEDGIPDLPPGIINIGHRHDFEPPRVIWNTDGDQVTWTVVNQLGTAGGVEETPTFNRFSTPFSVPLKRVSVQLQYVNAETGLQTGYASIDIGIDGTATVTERVDLGLPGGEPVTAAPGIVEEH